MPLLDIYGVKFPLPPPVFFKEKIPQKMSVEQGTITLTSATAWLLESLRVKETELQFLEGPRKMNVPMYAQKKKVKVPSCLKILLLEMDGGREGNPGGTQTRRCSLPAVNLHWGGEYCKREPPVPPRDSVLLIAAMQQGELAQQDFCLPCT